MDKYFIWGFIAGFLIGCGVYNSIMLAIKVNEYNKKFSKEKNNDKI
jgi:hypothetical protein